MIFLLIVISMIFYGFKSDITGLTFHTVSVNVSENMEGELTAFTYHPLLNLSNIQNITVEFTNTGTTTYNTTIQETIYVYDNGNLNVTAQYYDYTIPLYPGMRRNFKTSYVPPITGSLGRLCCRYSWGGGGRRNAWWTTTSRRRLDTDTNNSIGSTNA